MNSALFSEMNETLRFGANSVCSKHPNGWKFREKEAIQTSVSNLPSRGSHRVWEEVGDDFVACIPWQ